MANYEAVLSAGIVPVVVLNKKEDAVPLAKALLSGGIKVMEITFRTAAAADSIRLVAKEVPEILVGAGTILNDQQLDEAIEAGAKFVVSPGMDTDLIKAAEKRDVPIFPGAVTPGEIQAGLKAGISIFKFFPAGNYGGAKTIKSLAAPFVSAKFMPTGGVSLDNLGDYLAVPQVVAVGGSWMVKGDLIESGDFAKVTQLSREAMQKYRDLRS